MTTVQPGIEIEKETEVLEHEGRPQDRVCHLITEAGNALCGAPKGCWGAPLSIMVDYGDPFVTPCRWCGHTRCSRCALEYRAGGGG